MYKYEEKIMSQAFVALVFIFILVCLFPMIH